MTTATPHHHHVDRSVRRASPSCSPASSARAAARHSPGCRTDDRDRQRLLDDLRALPDTRSDFAYRVCEPPIGAMRFGEPPGLPTDTTRL